MRCRYYVQIINSHVIGSKRCFEMSDDENEGEEPEKAALEMLDC